MELTKDFLKGFCEALFANEVMHGYVVNEIALEVIEENNRYYAVLSGVVGNKPYFQGDHFNESEGGDPIIGEIEKIDLTGTWVDCKKEYLRFFSKMQDYFNLACETNYRRNN